MRRFFIICVVAVILELMLKGCAGNRMKSVPSAIKIIETIPASLSPDWVASPLEFWESKGDYYYRGLSEGFNDPEASTRDAVASARTKLSEQVKIALREEFKRAFEGEKYDPVIGGYLSDAFFSAVENIEFSGSIHSASYSQRIVNTIEDNPKTYWRSFVLVKIPCTEYKKSVRKVWESTKEKVIANKSAKELAEKIEKKFWEKEEQKQKESAE